MIEPRKFIDWWSLRVSKSGDNTGVPNKSLEGVRSGTNVRPGSESVAEQHWGLPGRWEGLPFPWASTGTGETGLPKSLSFAFVVHAGEEENARTPKVSTGEGDRVTETNEGSLNLCVVAFERRGTHPQDPPVSQDGGQIHGSLCGNYAWTPET